MKKIGVLFVKLDFHPNFDTFFRDRPYVQNTNGITTSLSKSDSTNNFTPLSICIWVLFVITSYVVQILECSITLIISLQSLVKLSSRFSVYLTTRSSSTEMVPKLTNNLILSNFYCYLTFWGTGPKYRKVEY